VIFVFIFDKKDYADNEHYGKWDYCCHFRIEVKIMKDKNSDTINTNAI